MRVYFYILAMATSIVFFASWLSSSNASAQGATPYEYSMYCLPQKPMLNTIMTRYGQKPVSFAYADNKELSIMYVNEKTGTWTFAVTKEKDLCVMASGDTYRSLSDAK